MLPATDGDEQFEAEFVGQLADLDAVFVGGLEIRLRVGMVQPLLQF